MTISLYVILNSQRVSEETGVGNKKDIIPINRENIAVADKNNCNCCM